MNEQRHCKPYLAHCAQLKTRTQALMFCMAYNCRLAACNLAGRSVVEQTAIIVAA